MKRKLLIILAMVLFWILCLVIPVAHADAPNKAELDPLFERIGYCESRNVAFAKNPNSSASGRFQFLKSSWSYYGKKLWGDNWIKKDIFNYWDNTELALYVYKLNGTRDWSESSGCWKKYMVK